ncbi:hypothetical protein FGIG_08964 [Fasciola gigantica]|uniref:Uncharacterized protein n=1 Tax=Fasciola gigantica TaxID=46835 RepID=A0A504YF57_FASGI|nr:hypothetical protein FGIG_08964 [Fasciola gigantica]
MCGIPCRLALAVINGVFLVISLITVVVGALFAWGQSFVKQTVEEAVTPIAEMAGGDAQKTTNEATAIIMSIGLRSTNWDYSSHPHNYSDRSLLEGRKGEL